MANLDLVTFLRQPSYVLWDTGRQDYDDFIRLRAVRNGQDQPDWRDKIIKGQNATTPLEAFTQTATVIAGKWELHHLGLPHASGNRCGITFGVDPMVVPAENVSEAQSIAIGKAYAQINRLLNSFSGQVFLGEIKETIRLLRHPFAQSVALTNALVKQRNVRKNVGKSWLEYQFALMPLLSDIDSLTKLLTGQIKKQTSLAYRSYGKSQAPVLTSVVSSASDYNRLNLTVNVTESLTAECAIHYGISQAWLEGANINRSDFASQFNQLASVPVTAWEFIPWSWLVDYFTNVSDIIEASFTSTAGVTFVSRSTISTHELTKVGLAVSGINADYSLVHATPRIFSYKKRNIVRVNTSLGIPSLVFSLPGSNIKRLNIAALIASII